MIKPKELILELTLLGFTAREANPTPASEHYKYVKGDTDIHIWIDALTPDYCRVYVNGTKFFTNAGVVKRASKDHVHV
jgi:hypothetical protein